MGLNNRRRRQDTCGGRSRVSRGGHRFKFTAVGDKTKVDHEVEMDPKGIWKLIPPLVSTEVKATPSPPGARAEQTLTSTSRMGGDPDRIRTGDLWLDRPVC